MQECLLTDDELLQGYLKEASEVAFAELVRRYVDLVYSAALRITSDPELARDVSQEVFFKLARQAPLLRSAALPAWLYRVTHAGAVNSIRAEAQRRRLEQEAMEMRALGSGSEPGWESLSPLIDQAMSSLGRKEQAAIVMHLFAGKKLAEVGSALGLTEEAHGLAPLLLRGGLGR